MPCLIGFVFDKFGWEKIQAPGNMPQAKPWQFNIIVFVAQNNNFNLISFQDPPLMLKLMPWFKFMKKLVENWNVLYVWVFQEKKLQFSPAQNTI